MYFEYKCFKNGDKLYIFGFCLFLLTYPLLFSDLWQADCMHSVLNSDSTWLWCRVVFPCDCESYWYGVHQICAVTLRASQHIYSGLCTKCWGINQIYRLPCHPEISPDNHVFFPSFLTSSTPQLQPLYFRELF